MFLPRQLVSSLHRTTSTRLAKSAAVRAASSGSLRKEPLFKDVLTDFRREWPGAPVEEFHKYVKDTCVAHGDKDELDTLSVMNRPDYTHRQATFLCMVESSYEDQIQIEDHLQAVGFEWVESSMRRSVYLYEPGRWQEFKKEVARAGTLYDMEIKRILLCYTSLGLILPGFPEDRDFVN